LSAAANCVEAASSSARMPCSTTALFTRAMGRKRPRASSSDALGAACLLHVLHFQRCLGISFVYSAKLVHNVVLPFTVLWIPLSSSHSCPFGSPPFPCPCSCCSSCNPDTLALYYNIKAMRA
jgi:hypothetical protein